MSDPTFVQQLAPLKGKLKKAAIDAYMQSEDWDVDGDTHYWRGDDGDNPGEYVTKPDANGEGGGVWGSDKLNEGLDEVSQWFGGKSGTEEWGGAFNDIRSRIDKTLEPWESLPDPGLFDEYIDHLRGARDKVAVTVSSVGGEAAGAGLVASALHTIGQNADAMSGALISDFKIKFLNALGTAIAGHHALVLILGQAMTAEQNLLTQARHDVVQGVTNATKSFEALAKGGSSDLAFKFKVAGAIVAGAGSFVTGGAAGALGVLAQVFNLAGLVAEQGEKEAKGPKEPTFDSTMDAFEKAYSSLNSAVRRREWVIADNLWKNLRSVQMQEGAFNLTNPMERITDDSQLHQGDVRAIIHNRSLVNEITDKAMPAIADELKEAAKQLWDGWSATPYYRDPSIGWSESGPYKEWSDLAGVVARLIEDLEWEVRSGAKTLDLAIEDMGKTDTDAKDALEKHAESLRGYTNYQIKAN